MSILLQLLKQLQNMSIGMIISPVLGVALQNFIPPSFHLLLACFHPEILFQPLIESHPSAFVSF
jgi:hypothetical protein